MSNNSCRIPRYATYPDCSGAKEKQQTSDLELRIRKEVMGKISDLICLLDDCEERVDIGEISGCPWAAARFDTAVDVQNLLKLLWGEDK